MDGPKRCDTCKLAIYDGYSCDYLDDPYYDTEENPWSYEDTPYITNKKRRAAGFIETENGYSYRKNMCMFVVLFDEDDDDDYWRRKLSTTNSSTNDKRVLKKGGKSKKSKGPRKIGCGQLIPEDEDDDYCD